LPVGISGYAAYVPRLRIKREEYAKAWGSFAAAGVAEKSVMGYDEDVLTMAAKAAGRALDSSGVPRASITRFALASTSPPYREKLLSGTVLVGLGVPNEAFSSDHTSSTRAGTEALVAGFEHLGSNAAGKALVAVADAPAASMWDPIEHALGAGAAAFVLAADSLLAEFEGHASYASEHAGERFRPPEEDRIQDLGVRKFSESSFILNTTRAATALLTKLGRKPEEYAHVAIQQPDARAPSSVAAKLGFTDAQLAAGLVAPYLGDLGAASAPLALAAAFDVAKVGDRILVVSYGSGAGSDALSFKVVADRKTPWSVKAEAERRENIDYVQYLKIKGAIE